MWSKKKTKQNKISESWFIDMIEVQGESKKKYNTLGDF